MTNARTENEITGINEDGLALEHILSQLPRGGTCGFLEVGASRLDRVTLAGDIELRAQA